MRAAIFAAIGVAALGELTSAGSAAGATLELRAKIPLPDCKGRIDHLAFDPERGRLFVAELGDDSVAVIDVEKHRLERRLADLDEPQGIAYFAPLKRLYVAQGGDGMVHAYDAIDLRLIKSARLASDADNIRIDPRARRLYVGYGDGALAVLDPETLELIRNLALQGHPESFQLSPIDDLIYVNVPDAREIAVVDRRAGRQVVSWPAKKWNANYPMAIDDEGQSVLSVFRKPARIARYSIKGNSISEEAEVCGDADDVFVDAKRGRVYVICGEGVVDVLDRATLRRIERFTTSPGARTGLYVPVADLLFVAARAEGGNVAAVWVLKPVD
jgi:hypothetical protein